MAARPEVSENRIAYRRGSLTEWYVNSAAGLEQGFTLASPPGRPAPGEGLVIALEVTGGMRPAMAPEGDAVWLESGGVARLRYSGLRAWDAKGRELDARLDVRGRELRLTVADAGAAYPLTVDPWIQRAKLRASDGAANDFFGHSVAVSGDTAVIGAYGAANQGAAYVFTRTNGVWSLQQKLLASDGAAGDLFAASVTVSGDRAVIGAYWKATFQGAAYVFTRSSDIWSQQQKLLASDGAAYWWFGYSVAVSEDTAVIGAVNPSAAYVFTRSNGVWSQQQELVASDSAANDGFGGSVAVTGDTAVIGAYQKATNQGAAYVFTRSNGIWSQQEKLLASDGTVIDYFGTSVAVSGNTAVIGAPGKASSQGAAYVFVSTGLQLQGVGSSIQFESVSLAAFQLAGAGAGHWTYNGGGQIIDSRQAGIAAENGPLSVVWDSTQTKVWTYLSVDSVVGNRAYFAQPRTILNVTQPANTAGENRISSNLWGADSPLPAAVLAVIQGHPFTAAFTDLLPADAKFAQNRVNCGRGTTATLGCLGYGTADPNIGTAIQSAFSPSPARAVNFNIYGTDPITGNAIPNYTVVPVGISPILFISNRSNPNGLGQAGKYRDITYQATAQLLFTGTDCAGTAFSGFSPADYFAINPILREPLSGTMNSFEFNIMVQNQQGNTANGYFSQESIFNSPYFVPSTFGAIQPATNNPLNGACPGSSPYAVGPQGKRMRAIGTDESVSAVKATGDSIGYLFFDYGKVSSIANDSNYGYLTYQTVDPINPSGSFTAPYVSGGLNYPGNGKVPVCTAPCPIPPGASFPNIRNGAYRAWSLLRAIADTTSAAALTNLQALAAVEQNRVNGTVPDFVPYNAAADGDPGFIGYRSHFAPGMTGTPVVNFSATNTPNNGITNPAQEAGGDVGGCLDYKTDPNYLDCRY